VLTDNYPFKAPADFMATSATYNTTINATAECGTLCLPFAATIPDGVTAYKLSYVNGSDAATLTPVETTIPANTPVLLNGSGAATFTGSGAVNADATNVSGALTGVFANTVVPLNSYVLQNGASGIGFYKVASDITAKPFRAYLTGEFAGSKDFLSFNFDKPTAISQVQGSGFKVQDSEIFNLAGQRMSKLQKGVNIVNGKKVMVK
jgi:glucuronoarabinoxylan endo-1,4-beta-xylanase